MGGSKNENIDATLVDAQGNIYMGGYFSSDFKYNVGAAQTSFTATATDVFLIKIKPDGTFEWIKQFTANSSESTIFCIALDASGNILVSGKYNGFIDLNPGTAEQKITGKGAADGFVVKLDNKGEYLWGQQVGSYAHDQVSFITSDTKGDIYFIGTARGPVDLDGSEAKFMTQSTGATDMFIAKVSGDGKFISAQQLKNTILKAANLDANGHLQIAGYLTRNEAIDFDPTEGVKEYKPKGANDGFVLKWKMQ